MSTFWNLWIIGLTLTNLILVFWVLMANRKVAVTDDADPENRTTGHIYDGIEEYDNPLPRWWFMMFIATFVFGIIYLALYPGLGSWKGLLNWTSAGQLATEQEKARENYEETFGKYAAMAIEDVARDPQAIKMGMRLYASNCSVCHGSDAGGNFGFPNLTDKDWLYGGEPETIKQTLINGRNGQMPAWGAILGEEKIAQTAEYVLSLSGQEHNATAAAAGATVFAQNCSACHGADGKGMHAMGAPNLTDDIWLYDGSAAGIRQTLRNGRANVMPAQKDMLHEDKIHLLAAYVYSLSLDADE